MKCLKCNIVDVSFGNNLVCKKCDNEIKKAVKNCFDNKKRSIKNESKSDR